MTAVVLSAACAALAAGGSAGVAMGAPEPGEMPYIDGGGTDGCGSLPVEVGDPNYDGACDPLEASEVIGEYAKTIDGYAARCRAVEERITYRATIGRNKIWEYVQQVEWCWNGVTIRRVNRVRFPRLGWAGSVYWDFKGHISSSCLVSGDASTCSELAGSSTAYIATQGKFQTITCGVRVFCITKVPGFWMRINAAGKVLGYGSL
jgi:hypothetical protein